MIDLICFCIMPNHLHMVLNVNRTLVRSHNLKAEVRLTKQQTSLQSPELQTEVRATYQQYQLTRIMRLIKGATARKANTLLQRTGSFWQHESYDHVVRDGNELERIVWYVFDNPVKAGLCKRGIEWKWSYIHKKYSYIVE